MTATVIVVYLLGSFIAGTLYMWHGEDVDFSEASLVIVAWPALVLTAAIVLPYYGVYLAAGWVVRKVKG